MEITDNLCPKGTWPAIIEKAEEGVNKKGEPQMIIDWGIYTSDGIKFSVRDYIGQSRSFIFKQIKLVTGAQYDKFVTPQDLIGLTCDVEIEHNEWNGNTQARIAKFVKPV